MSKRKRPEPGTPYGLKVSLRHRGVGFRNRYLAVQGEPARDDLSKTALCSALESLHRRGVVLSWEMVTLSAEHRIAPDFLRCLWLLTIELTSGERRRLWIRSGGRVLDLVAAARDGALRLLGSQVRGWVLDLKTEPTEERLWIPS